MKQQKKEYLEDYQYAKPSKHTVLPPLELPEKLQGSPKNIFLKKQSLEFNSTNKSVNQQKSESEKNQV
jgi:hypothetical protein